MESQKARFYIMCRKKPKDFLAMAKQKQSVKEGSAYKGGYIIKEIGVLKIWILLR